MDWSSTDKDSPQRVTDLIRWRKKKKETKDEILEPAGETSVFALVCPSFLSLVRS